MIVSQRGFSEKKIRIFKFFSLSCESRYSQSWALNNRHRNFVVTRSLVGLKGCNNPLDFTLWNCLKMKFLAFRCMFISDQGWSSWWEIMRHYQERSTMEKNSLKSSAMTFISLEYNGCVDSFQVYSLTTTVSCKRPFTCDNTLPHLNNSSFHAQPHLVHVFRFG